MKVRCWKFYVSITEQSPPAKVEKIGGKLVRVKMLNVIKKLSTFRINGKLILIIFLFL